VPRRTAAKEKFTAGKISGASGSNRVTGLSQIQFFKAKIKRPFRAIPGRALNVLVDRVGVEPTT
jgi:hypothetical protein